MKLGLKVFPIKTSRSKNVKHFNPFFVNSLKALQKHYKNHAFYHNLYVKGANVMDLKIPYLYAHYKENLDSKEISYTSK